MALLGCVVLVVAILVFMPIVTSEAVPTWVKLLLLVAILGGGILFTKVIRDRYHDSQSDKYKDIEL